ncbi:alpha/beta hydrolase [Loigolactobacillus iwatensis]|uniref:alpha/beta hydrolase n=1 Tax=Loigolactobacillus iwatensis TaxID=1267156 RepID=UPI000F7DEBA7|nr:alpha/beta hydrolase [Loigolactobacillus iwatensis]
MKCGTVELETPLKFKFTLDYYWKEQLAEDNDPRQWPIVLIFSGSAFIKMTQREGEPVALALNAQGYQAAVVQYNLLDQGPIYPNAIDIGLTAIQYVKEHAAAINGDPDKLVTLGLSAGAHIVTLMNALSNDKDYLTAHQFKTDDLRPAAQILGYPVIDLAMGFPKTDTEALAICPERQYWATQKLVTATTPPTFIWNTYSDAVVPVKNGLVYAEALADQHVPFDYHTFTKGKHGLVLSTIETSRFNHPEDIEPRAANWFELATSWLDEQFDLTRVDF